jgi:hypothetical protein
VDIYGARVTSAGAVNDPAGIPISRAASAQIAPAVASAGPDALVVWQDARNLASDIDIYGAIVQGDGKVSNPAGIPISTASGPQFGPSVAFNGNRYLVAWSDFNGTALALSGARVTTAGAVSDSPALSIDASGTEHLQPSVAAVGTMFLVVWEDYRNAGVTYIDILGKRVDDLGAILDRSPFPIGTAFSDRFAPAAAGGKDFLVVWQDGRDLGSSGHGRGRHQCERNSRQHGVERSNISRRCLQRHGVFHCVDRRTQLGHFRPRYLRHAFKRRRRCRQHQRHPIECGGKRRTASNGGCEWRELFGRVGRFAQRRREWH